MVQVISWCLVIAMCIAAASAAFPYPYHFVPIVRDQQVEESAFIPRAVLPAQDLQTAATGHGHYGRVQIKVYRGPTTGGHHEHFAPYGFWVKQPADDHH
ncbi:hypothetical protein C0J52_01540 [Blattella germanica]|nr:hypothetical protein C0J52_01540 [Blattella germanica]